MFEIVVVIERAFDVAVERRLEHQRGIENEQADRTGEDRSPSGEKADRRGDAVADADALKHAGDAKHVRLKDPTADHGLRQTRVGRTTDDKMHREDEHDKQRREDRWDPVGDAGRSNRQEQRDDPAVSVDHHDPSNRDQQRISGRQRWGGAEDDVDQKAEHDQRQRPRPDVREQAGARERRIGFSFRKRKWNGHADDEHEEREDQIGGGPAVPGGMGQNFVRLFFIGQVIDEQHADDGDAAKDVQRL